MPTYQIANWSDSLLEPGKTKDVKTKQYMTFPLKSGNGLSYQLARKDGRNIYGCFVLMAMICHSQPADVRDGWLTHDGTPDGTPIDAKDLAVRFRGTEQEWETALDALSNPEHRVNWLICHGEPPEPKAKKTGPKPGPDSERHTEKIYQAYPRKVAKQKGLDSINRALTIVEPEALLERVQAYAAAVAKWPDKDRKFIPHPATWFNGRRWEDDPETWIRKADEVSFKDEGFDNLQERGRMLDQWAKKYASAGNDWAAVLDKAQKRYGDKFAEDMVQLAKGKYGD